MTTPAWTLLTAFQTCLQRIKVADGYYTDAGLHVTLEPHQIPQSDGMAIAPAIETLAIASDAAVARSKRLATVVVICKLGSVRSDAQERLHELMDDIQHAFAQRQPDFPAGYQFPVFVDATPIAPADGMSWTGALVRFTSHIPIR